MISVDMERYVWDPRDGVSGESSSDTPGSLSSNLEAGFESDEMWSLSMAFCTLVRSKLPERITHPGLLLVIDLFVPSHQSKALEDQLQSSQ